MTAFDLLNDKNVSVRLNALRELMKDAPPLKKRRQCE